ncbi:MAG TPA: alpha/beta hydrolase [Alphaproteobacteria bacterium]|nr:alpha/beta hydrolase [Alphaproteobacteria bacterium]
MRPEDYPTQEPLSEFAQPYHDEVMRRAQDVEGIEAQYGGDPYQSILVYPAPEPNGDVLAFIHGGGWANGWKEWMSFMAPALTGRGVTFATVGYRLAPMAVFPSGFEDCLDAVSWLAANVAEHGGEPKRIFVGGHSAGGHYAALMAVRHDWQAGRGLGADTIRGCLPISGVYDFSAQSGLSARPRFLGADDSGNEGPASPVTQIDGTPPPFLIAHGEADFPHLIKQADAMSAALERAGGAVARLELPGASHLGASLAAGEADGLWVTTATDWMRRWP